MYHIYLDEEAVNNFAKRLASSKSFLDGTYTLYADVPVKCFGADGKFYTSITNFETLDDRTASQTVDFVIARGDTALLAICTELMASKSAKLFKDGPLRFLSNIIVHSEGDTKRKYRQLYRNVLEFLEEAAPDAPEFYTLSSMPLSTPVEELKRKQLLQPRGNVSAYGRNCGVFFRYFIAPGGELQRQPVTSEVGLLYYYPSCSFESDLPEHCRELQAFLDTPMDVLISDSDAAYSQLQDILQQLRAVPCCPASMDVVTAGDIPQLVYRMRSALDADNEERILVMSLTDDLLQLLGCHLAQPHMAARFPVLQLPIRLYFQQAAMYHNCHYPMWLYAQSVRPFLNLRQHVGEHTLHDLLQHRVNTPVEAAAPSFSDLLLAPLYRWE